MLMAGSDIFVIINPQTPSLEDGRASPNSIMSRIWRRACLRWSCSRVLDWRETAEARAKERGRQGEVSKQRSAYYCIGLARSSANF
jgi:hypothetical protein